jgi:hypothetical protein
MARLRYPDEALLEETDYLQIQILDYTPLGKGGSMLRGNRHAFKSGKGSAKQFLNSIFLPIPSNIQDGNSVSYADDTLDSLTAGVYGAIQTNIGNDNKRNFGDQLTGALTDVAQTVTGDDARRIFTASLAAQAANIPFGGNMSISQILAREESQILNPNMELLFNGVTLRSFKFSFKMTPRDTDEAKNIAHIINTLKKSMSPKASGTFLKTPNVFQLTYKKGPKIHPYLNLFKQCFLTDMSVNYTGEGVYATYNDGSPVSYTMDLGFKEIEPIYERDYDKKIDGNLVGF